MIAIASDHAGFKLKKVLIEFLQGQHYILKDFGAYSEDSVDYPDDADKVVKALLTKEAEKGILICGTGIGMSIRANRYKRIRAALCSTPHNALLAREHNDANILCLGARELSNEKAIECVEAFLKTPFSYHERHDLRIKKLDI